MGEMIKFLRPDGDKIDGYFAAAGKDRPGVVVIQEWWGLNPHICSIADRLAAAGYNALAPDLYRGRVTQNPDEAQHMMTGLDFPGATNQDIRGAVKHLAAAGGKVGVMGFCMGGALALAAAVHVPELAAAVCFYGIPDKGFADPANIKRPFQGHFANKDNWVTPQAVDGLEKAMAGASLKPEIYRYDADHAFCNATRPEVYDAKCANLAWERMLAFWKKNL